MTTKKSIFHGLPLLHTHRLGRKIRGEQHPKKKITDSKEMEIPFASKNTQNCWSNTEKNKRHSENVEMEIETGPGRRQEKHNQHKRQGTVCDNHTACTGRTEMQPKDGHGFLTRGGFSLFFLTLLRVDTVFAA